MNNIAMVIVEAGGINLQKPLFYSVPSSLSNKLFIGSRVLVPLGNRKVSGFVVGFLEKQEGKELKEVIQLLDDMPLFSEEQLKVALWMSDYYNCPPQRALKTLAYPSLKKTAKLKKKYVYLNIPLNKLPEVLTGLSRAKKQVAVLKVVAKSPGILKKQLSIEANASISVINNLIKKGFLSITEQQISRTPFSKIIKTGQTPKLTAEQKLAIKRISRGLKEMGHKVFLLHGVTGSGKTEVYLQCIAQVIKQGRAAITLVPEITLTPQMIKYFKERFGSRVALLHSRMSRGERYDEWERISSGEADIVLGTRSAIFAPVTKPGLFILDEEHEFTYKQEENPRYHARAVALYRAYINKAVVLLGSATPSLESYCRVAKNGPYELINMKNRVEGRPFPGIIVVDMRAEFKSGNGGLFSTRLLEAVTSRLEKREQIILFLNRRGYNTFVVCRECGLVMKCPNCDISLTYHVQGKLRCHYCGYNQIAPGMCPECRSPYINFFGTGTQKIEKEFLKFFPQARVLRMDADTAGSKYSYIEILNFFEAREADVLIGTQMVAKGLNFPAVTLVGIVNADTGLYMPDFRASERTFQIITQVAGRSGRADYPGEVIIQTSNPEHYAIVAASKGNYLEFFSKEMKVRKKMLYPPYSRMVRLIFSGREEDKLDFITKTAVLALGKHIEYVDKIRIVGPTLAPLSRVRGYYRMHIVLWSKLEVYLRKAVEIITGSIVELDKGKQIRLSVDVDPYNMM